MTRKITKAKAREISDYAQGCVGEGWRGLVDELITDLRDLYWDGKVFQVKEKFGGLRFYIGAGTKEIWNRIDKACEESYLVCERCGKSGRPNHNGWIVTLCDSCRQEKE